MDTSISDTTRAKRLVKLLKKSGSITCLLGVNVPSTSKMYFIISQKKEGGWIPVYQQITGITTVVKYVIA